MDRKRRALALALSGASTVPVWKKPMVDSLILPVHAQLSCEVLTELVTCASSNDIPICDEFFVRYSNCPDGFELTVTSCGGEIIGDPLAEDPGCSSGGIPL